MFFLPAPLLHLTVFCLQLICQWPSMHLITPVWPAVNTIVTFRIYDFAHQESEEGKSHLLMHVCTQSTDFKSRAHGEGQMSMQVGRIAQNRSYFTIKRYPVETPVWATSWRKRHTFRIAPPKWFWRTPASHVVCKWGGLEKCSFYDCLDLFLRLTSRVLL